MCHSFGTLLLQCVAALMLDDLVCLGNRISVDSSISTGKISQKLDLSSFHIVYVAMSNHTRIKISIDGTSVDSINSSIHTGRHSQKSASS